MTEWVGAKYGTLQTWYRHWPWCPCVRSVCVRTLPLSPPDTVRCHLCQGPSSHKLRGIYNYNSASFFLVVYIFSNNYKAWVTNVLCKIACRLQHLVLKCLSKTQAPSPVLAVASHSPGIQCHLWTLYTALRVCLWLILPSSVFDAVWPLAMTPGTDHHYGLQCRQPGSLHNESQLLPGAGNSGLNVNNNQFSLKISCNKNLRS